MKSTGPKTEAGKAVAKLNAVRHGLLSAEMLLKDEDREAFEQLRARSHERLKPEGELEELLVDRVVAGVWRLRRLRRVEADIFEDERYDHDDNDKGPGRSSIYRGFEPQR